MRVIAWHDAVLDPPRVGKKIYVSSDTDILCSEPVLGIICDYAGICGYGVFVYRLDRKWAQIDPRGMTIATYDFGVVSHWTPLPKMPKEETGQSELPRIRESVATISKQLLQGLGFCDSDVPDMILCQRDDQPNKKGTETMEEKKSFHDPMRISAPWQEFRNKLATLFAQDPQIKVERVEASDDPQYDYEMDICAYSHVKANALMELLGNTAKFENIRLKILIYDMENGTTASTRARLYRDLFEGNPVFDSIQLHVNDITGMEHAYVLFKPEALQYFDDDLRDPRGNASVLPQDIARDVFKNDSWATTGVSFCTAEVTTKEDHDGETESAGQ